MKSYAVSTKTGSIRSGETDSLFTPGRLAPGAHGVVLLHGSSAPSNFTDLTHWATNMLAGLVAGSGLPCIAGEMSGQSFANDAVMADIDTAVTYMANLTDVSSSRFHLIGASMGAYVGLRYATEHPERVASYTGMIPLCDLVYAYENNTLGLRAQIGTAWGVTYPTPLPARADVTSTASALNGVVPARFYYATDDTVIPTATVTAMAATTGGTAVNLGNAGGHNEPSIKAIIDRGGVGTAAELLNFLHSNGA